MHNEFYPYGIVDGYRMYFGWNYKSSDVEVKKRMGDYIFSSSNTDYPSAFSLYLISDEEIITLEDAYDSGKLKDIDTVAYMVMHNNWIGVLISKFEPTAEEQALIDYHTNKGTFYEGPESDYYGYKMLGEVQEYKLCHFTCEQPIPGGWSHHLGDYRIEAVFRESLYLVKDNEVVELQEAYDKGILTDVVTVVDILKETTGYEVFEKGEIKDPVGPYVTIASDRIKSGEKAKLLTVENVGDAEITFTSKTPEIAKVNQKGVVTALQKGMAEFEITFVDDTGKGKFTAKVKVTNNPKLEQKKVTINRKDTIKVAIKGKVKGIKNVYTNTKIAKIKSKPNASVLKVKGIKKGKTTLEIKVNGVKTLKLKVVVK